MAKDCNLICEPCEGEENYVRVIGKDGYEYYFQYCQKSIQEDIRRGFEVEIIDEKIYLEGLKTNKKNKL